MALRYCTLLQVANKNTFALLKSHAPAAHGAVAVACVLAHIDDDPANSRLNARDSNGGTPFIRFIVHSIPKLFKSSIVFKGSDGGTAEHGTVAPVFVM